MTRRQHKRGVDYQIDLKAEKESPHIKGLTSELIQYPLVCKK